MRPYAVSIGIAVALVLANGCTRKKDTESVATHSASNAPQTLTGPQVIHDMIAAHGGMNAWKNAPTFSFTERWGESPPTAYVVEQGRRRAYFEMSGTPVTGAWDGEKAWSTNWPSPTPVRFLALLNYYFINLPWLTQDPGVKLGETGTGRLRDDPTEYVTVMMTFEPGTGDTPDDYYRLYIHPETKLLRACDYIVTYRALMNDGQTSTPEHCLVYDQMTNVDGLQVPAHFTIYEGESEYATCTLTDYSLSKPFDEARMSVPEGAVIDSSSP